MLFREGKILKYYKPDLDLYLEPMPVVKGSGGHFYKVRKMKETACTQ